MQAVNTGEREREGSSSKYGREKERREIAVAATVDAGISRIFMMRVANSSRSTTTDRRDTRRKDSKAWEYIRQKAKETDRGERDKDGERIGEPAL